MRIEEEFGDAPWLTNDWMRPIAGQQQHIDTLEQHGKTAALPASRLLSSLAQTSSTGTNRQAATEAENDGAKRRPTKGKQ
jgi:hypothetical protein